MYDDELHEKASAYASNRHDTYIAKMQKGEVKKHSKEILNWIWVAHYEGYKEGYWTAKGDDRFTTDPDKLFNEKKHWVGLTDGEILAVNMSTVTKLIDEPIVCDTDHNIIQLGKAIEAKLKERNT